MIFNAFIVDDSPNDYKKIEELLVSLGVNVISTYLKKHPYKESLEEIKKLKPNLVIIDHELNEFGKTGLDLFREIETPFVYGIFCSRYPDIASRNANKFFNTNFVHKDFAVSVDENGSVQNDLKQDFKDALDIATTYFTRIYNLKKFEIDIGSEVLHINSDQIIFLEAYGKHTKVYIQKMPVPVIVKDLLKNTIETYSLMDLGFVKVHKSFVIYRHAILSISPKVIIMKYFDKNGKPVKIPIGPSFRNDPMVELLTKGKIL